MLWACGWCLWAIRGRWPGLTGLNWGCGLQGAPFSPLVLLGTAPPASRGRGKWGVGRAAGQGVAHPGRGWTLQCRLARHWQDLGYMILYITGRPDMQKQRVVSWLSQHNFPQGMIFFSDGLVHDPLRQKAIFLRNLMQEVSVPAGQGFLHRPPLLPQPSSFTPHPPIVQADAQFAKPIHVHLIGPFTAQRGVSYYPYRQVRKVRLRDVPRISESPFHPLSSDPKA